MDENTRLYRGGLLWADVLIEDLKDIPYKVIAYSEINDALFIGHLYANGNGTVVCLSKQGQLDNITQYAVAPSKPGQK